MTPAAAPWFIGFVSVFLVAPTNSGRGVIDSYGLFPTGSNLGHALAFSGWSGTALLAGRLLSRYSGPALIRASLAFGVPAVLSLYPAAVEDGFVYHDWLAGLLVISGLVTLTIALISGALVRS